MPHYADGSLATVGDIVQGVGYNLKDEDGNLRTITGVTVYVNPSTAACNITVLIPDEGPFSHVTKDTAGVWTSAYEIKGTIEYGQTDHFNKVCAPDARRCADAVTPSTA